MIQRGNGAGFPPEALNELLLRDLDGDSAAQSRVDRSIDFAHAALAELALDTIWPEECPGRQHRGLPILCQTRTGPTGRPVQKDILRLPGQQQFDFAAHVGIGFSQQRRALHRRPLASRMVQLFNLMETLWGHRSESFTCKLSRPFSPLSATGVSPRARSSCSTIFAFHLSIANPNDSITA